MQRAIPLLLLLSTSAAYADDVALRRCCTGAGLSACPTSLQAVGPRTIQRATQAGTSVEGPWELSCEAGAYHDPTAVVLVKGNPSAGDVVSGMTDKAARCFAAACAIPPNLCVEPLPSGLRVVDCATGGPPTLDAWSQAPVASNGMVKSAITAPAQAAAPTIKVYQSGHRARDAYGAAEVSGSGVSRAASTLDRSVPDAPPFPCRPDPTMREPSNQQVTEGDEARVRSDFATALGKYRAALSINRCNAFGWAALGDVLLSVGDAPAAQKALSAAVSLMPTHDRAWTLLGTAREASLDYPAALEAYRKAAALRPTDTVASDGVARLSNLPGAGADGPR